MLVAQVCDLEVGDFVHALGDAHIYSNHVDQVKLQLARTLKVLGVVNRAISTHLINKGVRVEVSQALTGTVALIEHFCS